jgi:RimJ/RimL family protein N-acetyltransferase
VDGEELTLTAPGLVLRPWAERDISTMVAAHDDPLMRRWLRKPITTETEARQVIQTRQENRRNGTAFSFAVVRAGTDVLVGSVVLRGLDKRNGSADVGYWVVCSARGQGVAPRALNAVCEWAFGLPALDRLELIHTVGNQASCRVADKSGFRFSAMLAPLPPEFPRDGHLHIRTRPVLPVPTPACNGA